MIAVNKADPEDPAREMEARGAARELAGALRLVRGHAEWAPPVVTCSGLTGARVDEVWEQIGTHREHLGHAGLARKRAEQQLDFTWALVRDELDQRLRHHPGVRAVQARCARRCSAATSPRRWLPTACSPPTTRAERRLRRLLVAGVD